MLKLSEKQRDTLNVIDDGGYVEQCECVQPNGNKAVWFKLWRYEQSEGYEWSILNQATARSLIKLRLIQNTTLPVRITTLEITRRGKETIDE